MLQVLFQYMQTFSYLHCVLWHGAANAVSADAKFLVSATGMGSLNNARACDEPLLRWIRGDRLLTGILTVSEVE